MVFTAFLPLKSKKPGSRSKRIRFRARRFARGRSPSPNYVMLRYCENGKNRENKNFDLREKKYEVWNTLSQSSSVHYTDLTVFTNCIGLKFYTMILSQFVNFFIAQTVLN